MELTQGKCIIVSAPSGAGKTTIVRHLLGTDLGLSFSISATSRPMRGYEVDGHDYFFMTSEDFRQHIVDGAFVEWEEVYPGRFYGTLRSEIERIWAAGRTPIFDVDVVGGLHLKGIFGENALALFIAPPSVEILEQRLRDRGTETAETLKARVDKAEHELTFAPRFDSTIVNNDREKACAEAHAAVARFLNP
ncbi:MAG TPA: guanylate kinase [Flavobacteriales bacterium]